ncbi:hypothetical protein Droror1_Dr00004099 [Drosera rotundifolia]
MLALLTLVVGGLIWAYRAIKASPPPPKVCLLKYKNSLVSPWIRLSDGRYLAYKIRGAAKKYAKHHVILSHGFCCSKDTYIPLSDEWLAEHGICLIAIDRPGYAESDPNPNRSPKSDAKDIEELADALRLGPKLYVIGLSMGNYPVWGCLKYIPHRFAGVALVVPVVNYWWPSLPHELCSSVFSKLDLAERLRLHILHRAPKLAWMLRSCLPWPTVHSMLKKNPRAFNESDMRIMNFLWSLPAPDKDKIQQQGDYVSLHKDMEVSFGKWEFDPLNIDNPFLDNKGRAHLWIGDEDGVISHDLQRYISWKLPWVHCHEVPGGGHSIVHDAAICEMIFKSLCLENN